MEPNIKAMDAFDLELAQASHQRSQAWRDIRAGKFTASEMWRIMGDPRSKKAKEAGEWGDEATTYINSKVAEEFTGQMPYNSSAAIEWGEDLEPVAKEYFTDLTGHEIKPAGFKLFNQHAGGSPDGFVHNDRISLIEIKCPYNSGNQIEYLKLVEGIEIAESYPKYWWQMQANMIFNKIDMCYFITFDPRFSGKNKMKVLEVYANLEHQNRMLERLIKAIESKLNLIKQLT